MNIDKRESCLCKHHWYNSCEHRQKSRVYVNIIGITLVNIDKREDSSVCGTIDKPLYEGKEYTIFSFTYSIFIVVGTLNFNLKATAQFSAGMYMEFCDNAGSVSVAVGLTPTLTLKVSAGSDVEIVVGFCMHYYFKRIVSLLTCINRNHITAECIY